MSEKELIVKAFGRLVDVLGGVAVKVPLVRDTEELRAVLIKRYPHLETEVFVIAVERVISHDKTRINTRTEVALLPPFSGG